MTTKLFSTEKLNELGATPDDIAALRVAMNDIRHGHRLDLLPWLVALLKRLGEKARKP